MPSTGKTRAQVCVNQSLTHALQHLIDGQVLGADSVRRRTFTPVLYALRFMLYVLWFMV
jgi:hypothetical protein